MAHDFAPEHWRLKGEGNANAVFVYCGNEAALKGQILRVSKRTASNQEPVSADVRELEARVWGPILEEATSALERQRDFQDRVLQPLLGGQYLLRGRLCQLPAAFQAALLAHLRQRGRLGTDGISGQALLLPDHSQFWDAPSRGSGAADDRSVNEHACPDARGTAGSVPQAAMPAPGLTPASCSQSRAASSRWLIDTEACICVELKPKCGFLPASPAIRGRHAIKKRVSRYRLHQRLKLALGHTAQLSAYDPLDLFSGDARRMESALAALLAVPQNNLRLFWRGAELPLAEMAGALRSGALRCYGGYPGLIRLLRAVLQREGVLDRLLAVQRLDVHDVEAIHPLLESWLNRHALQQTPSHECQASRGAPVNELGPAAAAPQHQQGTGGGLGEAPEQAALRQLLSLDAEAACEVLRGYLVAATAKDCSLMLTLAPELEPRGEGCGRAALQQDPCTGSVLLEEQLGRWFRYKLAVVDVDLKPLAKICAHHALDQAIMAAVADVEF